MGEVIRIKLEGSDASRAGFPWPTSLDSFRAIAAADALALLDAPGYAFRTAGGRRSSGSWPEGARSTLLQADPGPAPEI